MYEYSKSGSTWDGSGRVFGEVLRSLGEVSAAAKILDAGCGNGYLTALLSERGFQSYGVDCSETGIAVARCSYPSVSFECLDLTQQTGDLQSFDAVICIEVIEHVYAPRLLLANLFRALRPGGKLILSTPYHGYVKNLAVIASGGFDRHFNPLWDHGHIKFFSRATLDQVLLEAGFRGINISGIGRAPYLWKTMLATAQRPATSGLSMLGSYQIGHHSL